MAEWVRRGLDPTRHFSFTYCLFVSVGVCVQAITVHGDKKSTCGSCALQAVNLSGEQRPLKHLASSFFSYVPRRPAVPLHVGPRVIWLRITLKKLADLRNLTPGLLPKKAVKESKFYKKILLVITHSSFATPEQLEPKEFSEIFQIVIISKQLLKTFPGILLSLIF